MPDAGCRMQDARLKWSETKPGAAEITFGDLVGEVIQHKKAPCGVLFFPRSTGFKQA